MMAVFTINLQDAQASLQAKQWCNVREFPNGGTHSFFLCGRTFMSVSHNLPTCEVTFRGSFKEMCRPEKGS